MGSKSNISPAQVKEILDAHENTLTKFFNKILDLRFIAKNSNKNYFIIKNARFFMNSCSHYQVTNTMINVTIFSILKVYVYDNHF